MLVNVQNSCFFLTEVKIVDLILEIFHGILVISVGERNMKFYNERGIGYTGYIHLIVAFSVPF